MKINTIGHLVKTNPNKANVKIGNMNTSIAIIKDYDKNNEQPATNIIQNKAKQSQFGEDAGARGKIQMAGLSQEGCLRCPLK